jgi:putative transposase
VALSDGTLIENPRHFRAAEAKLAAGQRVLSRRVKFSSRWRKQAHNVARLHRHIANQRRDFAHKLSRQLAETYSLIVVENLDVLALSRMRLAKYVHDAGWGQLLLMLAYKVENSAPCRGYWQCPARGLTGMSRSWQVQRKEENTASEAQQEKWLRTTP